MRDIALPLQELLRSMDADESDAYRVRRVHDAFAQSVIEVYGEKAARLVLPHVQGVSIVRDSAVYKGDSKPPTILHVYADDSTIVSDLDARQQLLRMCLRKRGVYADSFKLYFSRFGMRERAPFATYFKDREQASTSAAQSASNAFDEASVQDMVKRLQVLKVALCQVFGEGAEPIVRAINAAYVRPTGKRMCNIAVYSADEAVRAVLTREEDAICAHMRDLGVPVSGYAVRAAFDWMAGYRAYPPQSSPVVVRKGTE